MPDDVFDREPAFSRDSGGMPLVEFPMAFTDPATGHRVEPRGAASIVLFRLVVTRGGPVVLKLKSHQPLSVWLDRNPLPLQDEMRLELTEGRHTVTFYDPQPQETHEPLRVELVDVPDLTARYRIETNRAAP